MPGAHEGEGDLPGDDLGSRTARQIDVGNQDRQRLFEGHGSGRLLTTNCPLSQSMAHGANSITYQRYDRKLLPDRGAVQIAKPRKGEMS
ncbi:Prolyl oligopeptidase-like protein [Mesorhizobium loti]|nr:Prolyl oligopeptidase-like protein [Mesorhizobium loti]